jgi:chromosome segregation ATPase
LLYEIFATSYIYKSLALISFFFFKLSVKMTALWLDFEKHREAQQEASNTAVQARIIVLEREVAENNALLQARGEEIA